MPGRPGDALAACPLSHHTCIYIRRAYVAEMRELIKLVSTAGTGFTTTTTKNKRTMTKKLELRKLDPIARRHVLFVEAKISRG